MHAKHAQCEYVEWPFWHLHFHAFQDHTILLLQRTNRILECLVLFLPEYKYAVYVKLKEEVFHWNMLCIFYKTVGTSDRMKEYYQVWTFTFLVVFVFCWTRFVDPTPGCRWMRSPDIVFRGNERVSRIIVVVTTVTLFITFTAAFFCLLAEVLGTSWDKH